MAKILKIVKADQTVHFAPLTAKAQLQAQNNLLPEHQKWTITEVDEALQHNHPWKDKKHVTGAAAEVINQKDKEIAELKAKLKAAETNKAANAEVDATTQTPSADKSTSMKADLAIGKIAELTTEADVNAFVDGETRVSVVKAATTKIAELKA